MARITRIATTCLVRDLHTPFVTALRRTTQVVSVAVLITDADGRTGHGEAPQVWRVTGESLEGIEACVRGPLSDALVGSDPGSTGTAELRSRLEGAVVGNGGARAACEMAVLDLLAQGTGQTLAGLLGGSADAVATDVTIAADGVAWTPETLAAAGFDRVKIKVGVDEADIDRVVRIHDSSPGVPLRLDANQAWDVERATAVVEGLRTAGVPLEFLEQPLPAWDIAGHAELRRRFDVPIVLDESVFTIHDLRRAIDAGAADIVNIKLAKCGGLGAGLAIGREARAAGLGVMVGSMMESELGVSAAAALAATLAPDRVHDLDAAWWSIAVDDAASPYRGGRFHLADSPGLIHAATRVLRGSHGPQVSSIDASAAFSAASVGSA
ncbi:enolase C-terminal domain-like protein [Propionicimonas sp.]|uniref:enolase C-terminal domain-like protein n=1 Tax=Propionicimonas sp. TaxID=1955623 RepID=UPI0039E53558